MPRGAYLLFLRVRPAFAPACAALLGLSLVAGCGGIADIERSGRFLDPYSQGDYRAAAVMLGGENGLDYDEDNLLTSLQAGAALRAAGSFEASQTALDRAESKLLWKADRIDDAGELLEAGLKIVGSDLISTYRGNIYDGVLVNTYKAMNALNLGDEERARVELNRADQRQENAVHQLAAKVKAIGEDDENEAAERQEHSQAIDRTYAAATKGDSEIGRRLAAVRALGEYRDLRNPFTDWLHGAFRLATGEAGRASDLFRNAAALDGGSNRHVLEDFRLAEAAAGAGGGGRRVWIVHEDGLGPRLQEFRFDLPVLASSGFVYAGIAVPEFLAGTPAVGPLTVEAGGRAYRSEPLLNVDRYAATEFRAGYDAIIGKAVASAVVKVFAQIAAKQAADKMENRFLGALLQIGTAAAAIATTRADTRMWQALPQSIGVASLPWPRDGRVRISAGPGGEIADLRLPPADFALITVKTVSSGAPAVVQVAALGRRGTASHAPGSPPIRPAAAFDGAGRPAIHLAAMTFGPARGIVRAGSGRAAGRPDIPAASVRAAPARAERPLAAHAAAEHSSGAPDWWKRHVSVDRALRGTGLRRLTLDRSVNRGGFARVAGAFFNDSDRELSVMYRFTWLDAGGRPVDAILSGWRVVHALPGTRARFHGTAPRDDIEDFHLELSPASRGLDAVEATDDQHYED